MTKAYEEYLEQYYGAQMLLEEERQEVLDSYYEQWEDSAECRELQESENVDSLRVKIEKQEEIIHCLWMEIKRLKNG